MILVIKSGPIGYQKPVPESGRKIGSVMRSESKDLIRDKAIGRKQSADTIEKRRLKMLGRTAWNKGLKYNLADRKKYGQPRASNPMYGKPVPKKVCPHCNKEVDIRNYARSHGDRCKLRI